MNCNTTHYRANSSSVPGDPTPEILDLYTRQRRGPQIEYVQHITIENKKLVSERDPAQRRARQDALRRIGADKKLAYEYLLNSSMIAMVRKAASIA